VSATLAIRIRAKIDLGEIVDYLAERNETAAIEFVESVHREFQLLKEHPNVVTKLSTTPRRLRGLRSWPVKNFRNYLIFYIGNKRLVEIVRLLHGARDIGRIIRETR
jgi:toxin ParE1/3/4